jgi:LPXTG-motif cell wall-anchored protein
MVQVIHFLTIIFGLAFFEIITSIDNAVVNAHVLKTLPEKYRKIFLFWGILFAVFIVRGLSSFIIVKIANPSLNFVQTFTVAFSSNKEILEYVEKSKPVLLLAGGCLSFLSLSGLVIFRRKKLCFYG